MSENKDCYRVVRVGLSFLLSAFGLLLSIRLTSLLHLLMSENKDCYRIVRVGLSFLLSAFCLLLSKLRQCGLQARLRVHQEVRLDDDALARLHSRADRVKA